MLLLRRASLPTIIDHTLHIRPILDVLVEATHMTRDLSVLVRCERDERDEADGEEGPAGYASGGPVAAVSALGGDVFGAFEVVLELFRAEGEKECHSVVVWGG